MSAEFFDRIYDEIPGHISLVTVNEETGKIDSQRWFEWPKERSTVEKYVELRYDEDVYCTVAVFSGEHRTKDDPHAVSRAVYADADTCPVDSFRVEPSIVVKTSDGRHHCWWMLDENHPAKDVSDVARLISTAHADEGCDSGWIIAKLLRVPGTTNTKYAEPFPVSVDYRDHVYGLEDLERAYADVQVQSEQKLLDRDAPKPLPKKRRLELEERLNAAGLSSLYLEPPPEGSDWSHRLFRLELDLFKLGFTPQEVFTIARESACNKYARDNRTESDLWKDVQRAQAEYEVDRDVITDDPVKPNQRLAEAVFLSSAERQTLHTNPCFVDQYTAWVATRTDSAERYQRSCAYMLLSSVLGDKGRLDLQFGPVNLNLWVSILGASTRSHKSTATDLMTDVLRRVETVMDKQVYLTDDATSESLIKSLSERDGEVSLVVHEEVQDWFAQLYSKNYRSGTLGTYTRLYDGRVPRVLRINKDSANAKDARTVFNFLTVGVTKRVAQVLNQGHFESGFLMRMLWAVADPPPRMEDTYDVALSDGSKPTFDVDMERMANRLVASRAQWKNTKPMQLTLDGDAQSRYNDWIRDAMAYVDESGLAEILEAATARLGMSVLKSAALLCMYEGSTTVTHVHMLHAIRQAELWFNDMVRMSYEVSASDYEGRQSEVEAYIREGVEGRLVSQVRRKFARWRPREQDEILTSLQSQGRIRHRRDEQRYEAL